MIYVTDEEFDVLSNNLQMGGLAFDSISLENKIIFMRDKFKEIPTKQIMTREEAIDLIRNVFGITNTGQGAKWINFFIDAGMLEVKKEEEQPIFEIRHLDNHIKIWANGKVEGAVGTVINRIPQFLKNNS